MQSRERELTAQLSCHRTAGRNGAHQTLPEIRTKVTDVTEIKSETSPLQWKLLTKKRASSTQGLPPGTYQVTAATSGYSQAQSIQVSVPVTETIRLSIPIKVAGATETISIQADVSPLQDDSIALGSVVRPLRTISIQKSSIQP